MFSFGFRVLSFGFSTTQNPKLKTQNSKPKTQNPKLKTQNPKLKTQNSKPIIMLGEGMPWHIILIFFALGIFLGRSTGLKEKKEESVKK